MELNAETVKRALEWCTSPDGDDTCLLCPYGDINLCTQSLMAHALALITSQEQRIKELTADLEAVRSRADETIDALHSEVRRLTEELEKRPPRLIITRREPK